MQLYFVIFVTVSTKTDITIYPSAMIKEHYRTPQAETCPIDSGRNLCQSLDDPELEGWNNDEEIIW